METEWVDDPVMPFPYEVKYGGYGSGDNSRSRLYLKAVMPDGVLRSVSLHGFSDSEYALARGLDTLVDLWHEKGDR